MRGTAYQSSAGKECASGARLEDRATTTGLRPLVLLLFFTLFLAAALSRQSLFHPLLFARLQVKRVALYLFDNVFLLHLPLEATQGVFQRFAFLQSHFRQRNYTPKPVPSGLVCYCKLAN